MSLSKKYHDAMRVGNIDACIRIEREAGLFGYPPELVSVGLLAMDAGDDPELAIHDYTKGADHAANLPSLLPCPFCGGEAEITWSETPPGPNGARLPAWSASCKGDDDPDCFGVAEPRYFTEAFAIAAWNRRAYGEACRGEWRPIESAPRDGTNFLGWFEGSTVQIWWMGQGGVWGSDFWEGREPTHWQSLPEPPTPERTPA